MAYDARLAERVKTLIEKRPGFSEKKMFGGIAFMIRGNMCCGVVRNDLMIRLTPEQVVDGLQQPHTRPMDFSGKPMKSMLYVGPAGVDAEDDLEKWVRAAVRFVLTLPPKPV